MTFAQLIATIDPANTGAAYHFLVNASVSGGRISSLADALGRSVPALTGNGSPLPAYSAGSGITTDGVQNYLETGATALTDLSTGPLTLIVAGTVPTTAIFPFVIYDATFARMIAIGSPGGSFVGVRNRLIAAAQTDITTSLVPDANVHLHIFSKSDTNSPLGATHGWTGLIAVPKPRVVFAKARSDVTTDNDAGNNNLSVGNATGAGAYPTTFRWAILLRKDLTAADIDALYAYAATDAAIVPYPAAVGPSMVAYGDSILQGFAATTPSTDNPLAKLVSLGALPGYTTANASIGGTRVNDWINYYATQVATDYLATRGRNIAWIGTGSNDLIDTTSPGPWTDTGLIAQYTAFAATLHARGFLVCIPTIIPRGSFSAQQNTYKDSVNAWLRSRQTVDTGIADIVVDPASAPTLSDVTNLTYYQADQVHLTTVGYAAYAAACQAGLAAGLARVRQQSRGGIPSSVLWGAW